MVLYSVGSKEKVANGARLLLLPTSAAAAAAVAVASAGAAKVGASARVSASASGGAFFRGWGGEEVGQNGALLVMLSASLHGKEVQQCMCVCL
jgi:hypothetical protein